MSFVVRQESLHKVDLSRPRAGVLNDFGGAAVYERHHVRVRPDDIQRLVENGLVLGVGGKQWALEPHCEGAVDEGPTKGHRVLDSVSCQVVCGIGGRIQYVRLP
eukprot:TRINITY_DN3065_c0_g1_i1.p3 TRINITY_DN3065_c0_g1~~TRINITY_DN3065_c0_g1_i1.p3  ORF type:complete len:104 (+),score=8.22 TRINITY_DN3065_c0_g1_i1:118-429(+)